MILRIIFTASMICIISACSPQMAPDYTPVAKKVVIIADNAKPVFAPKLRCPDWRHSAVNNHDNSAASNFGCSTASNMLQMVADKNDLLIGRGNHKAQTDTAISAVEALYRGDITPETTSSAQTTSE